MKKLLSAFLIVFIMSAALLPAAFGASAADKDPAAVPLDADGDGIVTLADAAAWLRARQPLNAALSLRYAVFLREAPTPPAETKPEVHHISQEEAAEMMKNDRCLVVDVRRQDEYDAGHIPGAVCIPNESIGSDRPEGLPDPDRILLLYCRSGVRAKDAAQKLVDIGYTNVYEFGGILDLSLIHI